MISNKPDHLLFLEPTGAPSSEPVVDEITQKLAAAWRVRRTSAFGARGIHHCTGCGAPSDNRDHWIAGYLSNSLAVHYVAHHRAEVPHATLTLIHDWPGDGVEPDEFELRGCRGGDGPPCADEAVARQIAAGDLVPRFDQVGVETRTVDGRKWTRLTFGEVDSGWCLDGAFHRLQAWCRGDVVTSAPPGQCSVNELSKLSEIAERDNRAELADAVAAAAAGGIDSDARLQLTGLLFADRGLIAEFKGLPTVMIRRRGAP